MSRQEKLLEQLRDQRLDASWNFNELCRLLQRLGFEMRVAGSHHFFRKSGVREAINLQPQGGKAKPYQRAPSAKGAGKKWSDMNSKFEIVVYWSEQDGYFLAEVPELRSIITDGASRIDALRNAEEMIDAYLEAARAASWPIPEPQGRLAFA